MEQTQNVFSRLISFMRKDIWRIRVRKLPKTKSWLIRQLRILLLAVRGFDEDKCLLRASSLTFYSLLSIVPVAAMAFGIAKGFGFEKVLEKQILEKMAGQEEVATRIIAFAQSFLENTKGGVIAGIGIAVLFWTVVKVLGNIEKSFNEIWGIRKGRSLGRKFSDYLSIMLICPILLIMSGSATVLITSQIILIMEKISVLGVLSPVIFFLFKLIPFVVLWVLFTFIYMFMPNTRVNFSAGLMGGIIGGTVYQLVQWVYISFQLGAAKYGAVYGSFAALPLFLIWLQMSWLVVLFGAEVSFAEQNVDTYELEPDSEKASIRLRQTFALWIVNKIVKAFEQGQSPLTVAEMVERLEIPVRLLRNVLFDLTQAGILAEVVTEDERKVAYHPALDVNKLTAGMVLSRLQDLGTDDIPVAADDALSKIKKIVASLDGESAHQQVRVCLKDI